MFLKTKKKKTNKKETQVYIYFRDIYFDRCIGWDWHMNNMDVDKKEEVKEGEEKKNN